jgi:hypothetical protein
VLKAAGVPSEPEMHHALAASKLMSPQLSRKNHSSFVSVFFDLMFVVVVVAAAAVGGVDVVAADGVGGVVVAAAVVVVAAVVGVVVVVSSYLSLFLPEKVEQYATIL